MNFFVPDPLTTLHGSRFSSLHRSLYGLLTCYDDVDTGDGGDVFLEQTFDTHLPHPNPTTELNHQHPSSPASNDQDSAELGVETQAGLTEPQTPVQLDVHSYLLPGSLDSAGPSSTWPGVPIPDMFHSNLEPDTDGSLSNMGTTDEISENPAVALNHGGNDIEHVVSSNMTALDMLARLVGHGCNDLRSQIDPEEYSECRVAEGGYGDVWKGRLKNGASVAIKVLRHALLGKGKSLKRMAREIYLWSKLVHENIHNLLGVTMFRGQLGMVSDWMPCGNLRDYLGQKKDLARYDLCVQISKGVEHIHAQGMVHGDLKASNILVSLDGAIKIADFDYSLLNDCSLEFTDTTRIGGGTVRWMAPELFIEDACQRNKWTDVYALGMTLLEVITGAPPYPECIRDHPVMYRVTNRILPKRSLEHFVDNHQGNGTWELLTQCWSYDPALRPTARIVLNSIISLSRM